MLLAACQEGAFHLRFDAAIFRCHAATLPAQALMPSLMPGHYYMAAMPSHCVTPLIRATPPRCFHAAACYALRLRVLLDALR